MQKHAIGHMTSIEKLRWWQTERPDLFISWVNNVTCLDTPIKGMKSGFFDSGVYNFMGLYRARG